MKIRPACQSDAATITDFNVCMAWETEQRRLEPATVAAGVAGLLNDPAKGVYYVAEDSAGDSVKPVGQLLITYEWSDWRNRNFWWIQSVYVAPEFRGKGVFRKLYEFVHDAARQQKNVCGLRLYVDNHNAGAQKAYTRLGMKPTQYKFFEIDFVLA
jgi:GNAT superfamily N-acetyltransferase